MRSAARWLLDYRNLLTLLATVLVVLLVVAVTDSITSRDSALDAAKQALSTRDQTAAAAARRVDLLNGEIADLQDQLRAAAAGRAQLDADVSALTEQVHQLGGRPVATPTTTTTTIRTGSAGPAPSPGPQPAPMASTTTTAPSGAPPRTTSTTVCRSLSAAGICLVP